MKAWEKAQQIFREARPVVRSEEEQTWTDNVDVSKFYDDNLSLDWGSNVPGSGAPEKIMVAAVQALENRGYQVSEAGYRFLEQGLAAHQEQDFVKLHQLSALLRRELMNAKKDENAEYWKYKYYHSFEEYEKEVSFPDAVAVDTSTEDFKEKIRAGWLAQLVGGAMGTMVEGYTSENLRVKRSSWVDSLVQLVKTLFLSSCWVIVLAPSEKSPLVRAFTPARRIPRTSIPLCS